MTATTDQRLSWLALVIAVLAVLVVVVPRLFASYRYRMTVEVQTPNGIKSASGVIEVSMHRTFRPLNFGYCSDGSLSTSYSTEVHGDAVTVDLGDGKTVFALLRGPDGTGAADYAEKSWAGPIGYASFCKWSNKREFVSALKKRSEAIELSYRQPGGTSVIYPVFVRFGDPSDPQTVRIVDRNDLGADLKGYRIVRIMLKMTRDPVTRGIEQRLPWLKTVEGPLDPYVPPAGEQTSWPDRVLAADSFLAK